MRDRSLFEVSGRQTAKAGITVYQHAPVLPLVEASRDIIVRAMSLVLALRRFPKHFRADCTLRVPP